MTAEIQFFERITPGGATSELPGKFERELNFARAGCCWSQVPNAWVRRAG
jgi:hypothetical protein